MGLITSTPLNLGPNNYFPNYKKGSKIKRGKGGRFGKDKKFGDMEVIKFENETYEMYSSLGK